MGNQWSNLAVAAFYAASLIFAFLVGNFLKPFIRSYSEEKAKNLATKEDIAQITKVQEEIKAEISDDVWGRQRQWELRRDVVIESVRALADLDGAVREFAVAWSKFSGSLTKEAEDALVNKRIEAIKQFTRCSDSYQRAHTVADVAIGGELSRDITGYFQFALPYAAKMQSGLKPSDRTAAQKELAKWHNKVILSAREALGIKAAGDLPVLNYDNESLTPDH